MIYDGYVLSTEFHLLNYKILKLYCFRITEYKSLIHFRVKKKFYTQ